MVVPGGGGDFSWARYPCSPSVICMTFGKPHCAMHSFEHWVEVRLLDRGAVLLMLCAARACGNPSSYLTCVQLLAQCRSKFPSQSRSRIPILPTLPTCEHDVVITWDLFECSCLGLSDSYWSFNEQSAAATHVACPGTQRLDEQDELVAFGGGFLMSKVLL